MYKLLIAIIVLSNTNFSQISETENTDSAQLLNQVLISIESIQEVIRDEGYDSFYNFHMLEKITVFETDCGDTVWIKSEDRNSEKFQNYLTNYLAKGRIGNIIICPEDYITVAFSYGADVKFINQELDFDEIKVDTRNCYYFQEEWMKKGGYSTVGGFSLHCRYIEGKLYVFRIEFGYSC